MQPNIEHAKLQLTAAILNAQKEIEIYSWLALVVPEYGTKPFNQRFITWLNKKAMERFGTQVYEKWGLNGEDKTVPKINFYMRRSNYTDKVQFEFQFTYKGKDTGYSYPDSGPKQYVLRDSNDHERLYGIAGVDELVKQLLAHIESRQNSLPKLKQNLKDLPKLQAERANVEQEVRAYNDKITYALGDDWRVKR